MKMHIPLFPLNAVLFPGMVMPLHVFEDRYKTMIQRCLNEDAPFGVVLILEGTEVAGPATPHQIGTLAHITDVEHLDDGRMNINVTGTGRFRIRKLFTEEAYLSAEVEPFPLGPISQTEVRSLVSSLQPRIASYLQLMNEETRDPITAGDMPDDPIELAYLIAIALQLPMKDKQALLQVRTAQDLLARENALLGREHGLLRYMVDSAPALSRMTVGPTGHLFLN